LEYLQKRGYDTGALGILEDYSRLSHKEVLEEYLKRRKKNYREMKVKQGIMQIRRNPKVSRKPKKKLGKRMEKELEGWEDTDYSEAEGYESSAVMDEEDDE
jgi:hypothetical protein